MTLFIIDITGATPLVGQENIISIPIDTDEEKNDSKLNSRAEDLSLHDKECVTIKFHMAKRVLVLQTIM